MESFSALKLSGTWKRRRDHDGIMIATVSDKPLNSMLSILCISFSLILFVSFCGRWIWCKNRSSCSCIDLETTRRAMCAATAAGESSRQALLQKKNHYVSLISMQSSSWNLLGNWDRNAMPPAERLCSMRWAMSSGHLSILGRASGENGKELHFRLCSSTTWMTNILKPLHRFYCHWESVRYGFDAMSDDMRLWPRGNENRTRNLNMGFCDDSCDDKDIDERSKENARVWGVVCGGNRSPRNLNPILHNYPICWESWRLISLRSRGHEVAALGASTLTKAVWSSALLFESLFLRRLD